MVRIDVVYIFLRSIGVIHARTHEHRDDFSEKRWRSPPQLFSKHSPLLRQPLPLFRVVRFDVHGHDYRPWV